MLTRKPRSPSIQLLVAFVLALAATPTRAATPADRAVQVSAAVHQSPPAITLSWPAAPDQVRGYHVYRAATAAGPFTRVSIALVPGTRFIHTHPTAGDSIYMVRAIKLELTSSGTYFNPSQGIFQSVAVPQRLRSYLPAVIL